MRGALLVCMLALCLLTLDNSMVAKAGKVTKMRKYINAIDEFKWCCKVKGCPFTIERRRVNCRGFFYGKKVTCMCK